MFLEHSSAKVTINISGILTELLDEHGAGDIISDIKNLAENSQLEFVDSGKYHPILPLIPGKEVRRQITLNKRTNFHFFRDAYKPKGFFPPEMCFSGDLAQQLFDMGYEWVLLSGIACPEQWPLDVIYKIPFDKKGLSVFFRDDVLSNKISFHSLDSEGFIAEMISLTKGKQDAYIITAMDAETFGHHIQHWEDLFLAQVYEKIDAEENSHSYENIKQKSNLANMHREILNSKGMSQVKVVTISELLKKFSSKTSKMPIPSSWSTNRDDLLRGDFYPLWKSRNNRIHELQWEHIQVCFELTDEISTLKGAGEARRFATIARGLLDMAIHSCQFWWANKERGLWDINLVNKGLMLQEEVVLNAYKAIKVSKADDDIKREFYHKVIAARDTAGKIRDLLLNT